MCVCAQVHQVQQCEVLVGSSDILHDHHSHQHPGGAHLLLQPLQLESGVPACTLLSEFFISEVTKYFKLLLFSCLCCSVFFLMIFCCCVYGLVVLVVVCVHVCTYVGWYILFFKYTHWLNIVLWCSIVLAML